MMLAFVPAMAGQPGNLIPIDPVRGIRNCKIIFSGLLAGLAIFLMIALVVSEDKGQAVPIIAYMAAGHALITICCRFIVTNSIVGRNLKALPDPKVPEIDEWLFAIFQTRLIVALAMYQGAGFFNVISYITDHQWWTIGIVGLLMFLMLMMYPTLDKFEVWANDVKHELQLQG